MKTNNELQYTAQNAVTSQTWLPRPYRIRILFTQRWGCGSNDESISQPVSPASQHNILHPLIHASIHRFSHCSRSRHTCVRAFRLLCRETLEFTPGNQFYKTVRIFLNSQTPFTVKHFVKHKDQILLRAEEHRLEVFENRVLRIRRIWV